MSSCPRCRHVLHARSSFEVGGRWQQAEDGFAATYVIHAIWAEDERCPACGFQEVVDFQQIMLTRPLLQLIALN